MENVRRWVRWAWAQNMVLLSTHELSTSIYLFPRLSLPGLLAKIRWRIRFLTKKQNYLSCSLHQEDLSMEAPLSCPSPAMCAQARPSPHFLLPLHAGTLSSHRVFCIQVVPSFSLNSEKRVNPTLNGAEELPIKDYRLSKCLLSRWMAYCKVLAQNLKHGSRENNLLLDFFYKFISPELY